ncbi:glycosyltransferase family 2 protein [Mucilaginibacter sp. SG564]|uniref:glycosyltransferase family 2 protein n=1 Tax=unclassified Mucilaginibacter TaxID=2617802 RepID=UPI001555C4B9|nr:glycosyltransferase family 2 protein [Mucilaginibacter sp. SG564]NOW97018.1 glycosyltransferase involved in cell wall biosynthesis [Mucilaginibacter sp. SG564]
MIEFSIIIATYNSEDVIGHCLQSVVDQTYQNYEIIIVDGNSKDSTLSEVGKFSSHIAHTVSEPDKGVYDAWNKGLKLASGNWIMFVGSDDQLLPDCLQSYHEFIIQNKLEGIDFISSKNVLLNNKGEVLKTLGGEWTWNVFKKYMNLAHVGALHHKLYFEKYGIFNDSYKIAGDYELLLRAKHNLKAKFLDKVNAKMGYGGISTASARVFKETFKAKNTSGGVRFLSCFIDDLIARLKYFYRKTVRNYE